MSADEQASVEEKARDMAELVSEFVHSLAAQEYVKAEADLLALVGPRPWPRRIRRSKIEVVWQAAPGGQTVTQYRGIRQNGRMIVDRFPDWPML